MDPDQPSIVSFRSSKPSKPHSCVVCAQRKVKCDKQRPCSTCSKNGAECIYRDLRPPQRGKKRLPPDEDLQARITRYEELLCKFGIDPETGRERHPESSRTSDRNVSESLNESAGKSVQDEARTVDGGEGRLIVEEGKSRYVEGNMWKYLGDEVSEERAGSLSKSDVPNSHRSSDGLIFENSSKIVELSILHPPPAYIFLLWQIFLDNVNPLVKVFHAPTVQSMIDNVSKNSRTISPSSEALLFAIYLMAIVSSTEQDCRDTFKESKSILLERYHHATQQALLNAGLLRTADPIVLQAYVLYLLRIRPTQDPRSFWTLTGIAMRIGQRAGLHRDGLSLGLSPFESEIRCRLWWQVVTLDDKASNLCGMAGQSSASLKSLRRPLNINDSDLDPKMKELPTERDGATEMIFCFMRNEVGKFLLSSHLSTSNQSSGTGRPNPTECIDGFESLLESKVLRYCDPLKPLHFFTAIVARCCVSMMHLGAHRLFSVGPRNVSDMSTAEKRDLFAHALKQVETDNLFQTSPMTQKFLWHINAELQWHSFVYLLFALRDSYLDSVDLSAAKADEMTTRKAWSEIDVMFTNRSNIIDDDTKALHVAICSLALKAWEAYEARTMIRNPHDLQTPRFVTLLRAAKASWRQGIQHARVGHGGTEQRPQQSDALTPISELVESVSSKQQSLYPKQRANVPMLWEGAFHDATIRDQILADPFSMDIDPLVWDEWDRLLEDPNAYGDFTGGF